MPNVAVSYSLSGQPIQDPRHLLKVANKNNLPTRAWLNKANRFILPKGKNPGIGWLLMLQKDFSELNLNETHFLKFEQGGADKRSIVLSDLVIVKADAVYAPGVITDESLYLVELADKRHLFLMSAINKDYNVLSPDGSNFFDDSLNSGSEWTWQEVLDDLWNSLPDIKSPIPGETTPQLFVDPANDFLLTTNPENLRFRGISAWEAINHILDRLNYAAVINFDGQLRYDPEWDESSDSGTFGAKGILDKAITNAKALDVSLSQQGTLPRIPEKIRVFFPSRETADAAGESYLLERSAETVDVTSSTVLTDVATSPSTVMVIWDELEAVFSGGTIQNQTNLNTRATEVATAFLKSDPSKQSDSRLYLGLLSVLPGTFAAFVAWGDVRHGLTTETGQEIPGVIKDRETKTLEPMQNEVSTPCGDLLAGWTPNQTNDSDEPKDAGTAVVTLTSDDVPTFGTNTVNRVPGFVNPFAWHFNNPGSSSPLESTLWVDDTPDFLDITEDFTVRYVFKMTDLTYVTTKYLWDMRTSLSMRVSDIAAVETFQLVTWDGTAFNVVSYAGLIIEEDVWYGVYLLYDKSTKTLSLSVTKLEDEVEINRTVLDPFQDFVLATEITASGTTLGFFLGERSDGLENGMRGFMDGHITYQKKLPLCQVISDFNRGKFRVLPTANQFFPGEGGIHYRDHTGFNQTTDASTVNLIVVPIPDESAVCVESIITAFRTDAATESTFRHMALFERRGAGAATLTGQTVAVSINGIGGTATVTATVVGNNGIIQVTGRLGNSINWHGHSFILPGS